MRTKSATYGWPLPDLVQISGIREAAPGGHDVFRLSMANGEDSEANDFEKPSVKSLKTARLQTQAKKILPRENSQGSGKLNISPTLWSTVKLHSLPLNY